MKFMCLGYLDEAKWESMTPAERDAAIDACLAYDDDLKRAGHYLGGEALQSAESGVTLKAKGGDVVVTDGPYVETRETLGGILFLEARDLNHAIALMSQHPGVRIGPFEIRPVDEEFHKFVAARTQSRRQDSDSTASRMGQT